LNALEKFYVDLDKSDWDVNQEDAIIQILKEAQIELANADLEDQVRLALVEHQVFQFVKTPQEGLSPSLSGVRKTDDGKEVPFGWPDLNWFNYEDFDYINNRFSICKNSYAKTEYGLVLYYSKKQRHDDFVLELLKTLFDLFQHYIEKGKEDQNYIFKAEHVLSNTLHIAKGGKRNDKIASFFIEVIQYTFDLYQKWDIKDAKFEFVIIRYCIYFVDYFKDANEIADLKQVLIRNFQFANSQSNSDLNTLNKTIQIADVSINLSNKLKIDTKEWQYLKAGKYEKIAEIREGDLADIHFVEKAISIYKDLKDDENLKRMHDLYQNLRTKHSMSSITHKMPQSETNRIIEVIKKEIEEKDEKELIKTLLLTPMLKKLELIKKESEESFKEPLIKNYLPSTISDKFGNTVAQFLTLEERKQFELQRTYGVNLDIATQFISRFFINAYRANKLSAGGIIDFLSQSWLGKEAVREINNRDYKFSYIKSIESGIHAFFDELKKWNDDSTYIPNLICATDSLVLKAEYLLREICRLSGIPIFKPNPKQEGITMEKLLHDLLNDLDGKLSEDDHFFIKFVLSDKVGYNLRNEIAHGLMDNIDYQLEHVLLAILIILKLSNYQFKK